MLKQAELTLISQYVISITPGITHTNMKTAGKYFWDWGLVSQTVKKLVPLNLELQSHCYCDSEEKKRKSCIHFSCLLIQQQLYIDCEIMALKFTLILRQNSYLNNFLMMRICVETTAGQQPEPRRFLAMMVRILFHFQETVFLGCVSHISSQSLGHFIFWNPSSRGVTRFRKLMRERWLKTPLNHH